jgi:hypothetical protein
MRKYVVNESTVRKHLSCCNSRYSRVTAECWQYCINTYTRTQLRKCPRSSRCFCRFFSATSQNILQIRSLLKLIGRVPCGCLWNISQMLNRSQPSWYVRWLTSVNLLKNKASLKCLYRSCPIHSHLFHLQFPEQSAKQPLSPLRIVALLFLVLRGVSPDLAPAGVRSGEYGGWTPFCFPAWRASWKAHV